MFNIDLFQPDFYIDVASLKHANQIYAIFRKNNIKKNYVYAIAYRKNAFQFKFLKVGMSYPSLSKERKGSVGERLVRQLGHVPTWSKVPISSNGCDLWFAMSNAIKEGRLENIDRSDLVVGVWDIRTRTYRNNYIKDLLKVNGLDADAPTLWAEGELSRQHQTNFGWRPPFNDVDPANNKICKGYVDPQAFSDMFQFS